MLGLMAAASVLLGAALVGSMDFSNTDEVENEDDAVPEVDAPSDIGNLLDDEPIENPADPGGLLVEFEEATVNPDGTNANPVEGDGEGTAPPKMEEPDQLPPHVEGPQSEPGPTGKGIGKGLLDLDLPNFPDIPDVAHVTGSEVSDVLKSNGKGGVVDAGGGNDRIIGGANSDFIIGGEGNDSIRGGEGNNVLAGGAGSDMLIGVEADHNHAMGFDTFYEAGGAASADIMDGGDGDDVLRMGMKDTGIGGDGADMFFVQGAEPGTPDADIPEILDFTQGVDTLVISYPFTEDEIAASWPDVPERETEISIENYKDGTGATVYVNGQAAAKVTGGQDLDARAVQVVGNEIVGADRADINATGEDETWWSGADNDQTISKLRGNGLAMGIDNGNGHG